MPKPSSERIFEMAINRRKQEYFLYFSYLYPTVTGKALRLWIKQFASRPHSEPPTLPAPNLSIKSTRSFHKSKLSPLNQFPASNAAAFWQELIGVTEFENCRKYSINSRSFLSDTFQENPSEIEWKGEVRQHLLQNPTSAREYNDNKFSVLALGRTCFHVSTLKATYIKTSKPCLCKQKEFVYGLKITQLFPLLLLVVSFTNHDGAFFLFSFKFCQEITSGFHFRKTCKYQLFLF